MRAPLGISDAARGLPRLHHPARVLFVSDLPEARARIERLASLYAGQERAFRCKLLLGLEVTPERVLQELEAGEGYDAIHILSGAGYSAHEPYLFFYQDREDMRLMASALRPIFSRTPPALLVVDSKSSIFLPADMGLSLLTGKAGFAQLAAETGVGAFLGSCGPVRGGSEAVAVRLHQGLVGGETIAEAVFRARVEAHKALPDDPSPLYYLLSGHGDLTLR
jgi:hypothetical protein